MNDFPFVFKGSQASESIDEKEHICYFSPNSKNGDYLLELTKIEPELVKNYFQGDLLQSGQST